jgi:hypothetical protein
MTLGALARKMKDKINKSMGAIYDKPSRFPLVRTFSSDRIFSVNEDLMPEFGGQSLLAELSGNYELSSMQKWDSYGSHDQQFFDLETPTPSCDEFG